MPHRIARTAGLLIVKAALLAFTLYARDASEGKSESVPGAVVELFTSEGCSSCPPADALLRQIDGKQTQAGRLIIGISEHVTYWNHLGWSDPFSSETYTQRQDGYAKRFHLEGVYTPQIVIDGNEQIVGSDRAALQQALLREPKPHSITIKINALNVHRDLLAVDYSVASSAPTNGADLFAVIADDAVQSSVSRGENSGRVLTHASVARSMTRIGEIRSSNGQTLQIPLPQSASAPLKQNRHLILFAQAAGLGRVLGATEKSF
jgi:hypothetical protein